MAANDAGTRVTTFPSERRCSVPHTLLLPCIGWLGISPHSLPNSVLSLQPTKVLGIYTFTKRVALEEMENKPRKQQGYSTVSHFNIVHYDCHLAAVR